MLWEVYSFQNAWILISNISGTTCQSSFFIYNRWTGSTQSKWNNKVYILSTLHKIPQQDFSFTACFISSTMFFPVIWNMSRLHLKLFSPYVHSWGYKFSYSLMQENSELCLNAYVFYLFYLWKRENQMSLFSFKCSHSNTTVLNLQNIQKTRKILHFNN